MNWIERGRCIQRQADGKKERAGLLVLDPLRGISLQECPSSGNTLHNATSYCNGRLACKPWKGGPIWADWHTHSSPRKHGQYFSPPSHSDLYQLILSSFLHGTHHRSVVFATEGIYVSRCGFVWKSRALCELRHLFRQRSRSLGLCMEPRMTSSMRRQYPYLHRLLVGSKRCWISILKKPGLNISQQISIYSQWTKRNLDITIELWHYDDADRWASL